MLGGVQTGVGMTMISRGCCDGGCDRVEEWRVLRGSVADCLDRSRPVPLSSWQLCNVCAPTRTPLSVELNTPSICLTAHNGLLRSFPVVLLGLALTVGGGICERRVV